MKTIHFIFLSSLVANLCLSYDIPEGFLLPHKTRYQRIRRDSISNSLNVKFMNFVEEKLIEHSTALDFILKTIQRIEGLLKTLQEKPDVSSVPSILFGTRRDLEDISNRSKESTITKVIPILANTRRNQRDVSDSPSNKFTEFVQDKLKQHSSVLEFIANTVHKCERLLNKMLDKLNVEPVESIVTDENARRSFRRERMRANLPEKQVNPIVTAFNSLPKFGQIARRLIENEFRKDDDPIPIMEYDEDQGKKINDAKLMSIEDQEHGEMVHNQGPISVEERKVSGPSPAIERRTMFNSFISTPWCRSAALCKGDKVEVCGHDENHGYGKFEDACHMTKYNCQSHSNYVIVSCNI